MFHLYFFRDLNTDILNKLDNIANKICIVDHSTKENIFEPPPGFPLDNMERFKAFENGDKSNHCVLVNKIILYIEFLEIRELKYYNKFNSEKLSKKLFVHFYFKTF